MNLFGETTIRIGGDGSSFLGGLLGGMLVTISIFALFYYILLVIAGWKVFEKAGEKGWKSLIPIYNTYIFYKIVAMEKWFWILLIVSFVISLITSLMGQGTTVDTINVSTGTGVFAAFLTFCMSIFAIVVSVFYSIRTAKAFGHGTGFAVGLILLQGIFLMILGFDKSKYNAKLVKSWNK